MVEKQADTIFRIPTSVMGIDLRVGEQLALVAELAKYYDEQPFPEQPKKGSRYYFDNGFFGYGDALLLYALLRHRPPRRVIEIGSGFSSAAMLDTAERFLDPSTSFTFIEPHTKRLDELLAGSTITAQIRREPVQVTDGSVFEALDAGDVLFIDSTHVSKVGSDVNRLFFDVLPALKRGVMVHLHDIFFPFEYPKEWIRLGRAWNEAYLLRAFLMHNSRFRIIVWNSYLGTMHRAGVEPIMPLWAKNTGGSIWLEAT